MHLLYYSFLSPLLNILTGFIILLLYMHVKYFSYSDHPFTFSLKGVFFERQSDISL
jgi:hypothetical protein